MPNILPNQQDGIINKGFSWGLPSIWGTNHIAHAELDYATLKKGDNKPQTKKRD